MLDFILIGRGKTGSHVIELANDAPQSYNLLQILGSKDKLKPELFERAKGIIIFTPGDAFLNHKEALIDSGLPLIIGATGIKWEPSLINDLKEKKVKWIHGHNFSLGMNIVRHVLDYMNKLETLLPEASTRIHEIHHTKKLDAPSGTALKWQDWFNKNPEDIEITHDRIGDVIGIHELHLSTKLEKISLRHESLDRKLFAKGALWALENIEHLEKFEPGIIPFEDFVDKVIKTNIK